MKTIFCPNHDSSNESINKEVYFLHEFGIETSDFIDFKKCPWRLASLSAVNLNWYDDINEANRIKALLVLVKKIITISFLKISRVKIIYTLHNKIAHDGKSPKENLFLKKFILKRADVIALLSSRSKEYAKSLVSIPDARFFYIGHPAYSSTSRIEKTDNVLTFLYFGMVRPYKNIETLIKAWEKAKLSNSRLIIAGKPISEDYRRAVEKATKGVSGVELILKYIDNDDLDSLISSADVIVSPLNKRSSMNSGTLVKTMCMKKTIIIPDIEMVYDYDLENMFVYSYDSDSEHEAVLSSTMKKVFEIYSHTPCKLQEMGSVLFKSFMRLNSDEIYKQRYKELYFDKCNKDSPNA